MKTALLNLSQWVEILELNTATKQAFVLTKYGEELEVSLDSLDCIEDTELDLSPLEKN